MSAGACGVRVGCAIACRVTVTKAAYRAGQALAARQVGRTAVAVVVAAVGGRGWGGGGSGGGAAVVVVVVVVVAVVFMSDIAQSKNI